jgi:hypothetical protein
MELSDKEVEKIKEVMLRLKKVGNNPRRNQVYNLALSVSKIMARAERREKNTLL